MGKPRKRQISSSSSSSDDSDDGSDSVSGSGSDSDASDRALSGQKDSDGDGNESDVDVRDAYLLETFKPKEIKSEVSSFAKSRLRGPFLGTKLGKQERLQIKEDYYCSQGMEIFSSLFVKLNYHFEFFLFRGF